ncbi:MAG: hypothetical protein AAF211_08000 [Myxococcota bacterium]
MQRIQTVFLGLIAASLLLLTAERWFAPAHAAPQSVTCQTLTFEWTESNKKALENLGKYEEAIGKVLAARAAAGQLPVYHVAMPIANRVTGAPRDVADIVCFASVER